jgi:transcriptional regulator with XRE-family HTH domain
MGKKQTVGEILAENLGGLMEVKKVDSGPKLAKLSKVSQKSISNMLSNRHDPYLSTVEKVAVALGISPFMLLCPDADKDFLAVCLAWAQSDERGRGDLHAIAEAILKRQSGGTTAIGSRSASTNSR